MTIYFTKATFVDIIGVRDINFMSQNYDNTRDELYVYLKPPPILGKLKPTFDPAVEIIESNNIVCGLVVRNASRSVVSSVTEQEREEAEIGALDWNMNMVELIKKQDLALQV
ncbi:hypothetical protein HK097_005594 [Rhizophlyctis rosea]|uniref:Uncharacterized protein n=1 Tax=Rhizophlyctis rosea TaxID=64517 RepID=A0AAD5SE93_9FUNG|nr:hypothetical protein HK097_005594 [Rhizophlyctis rosea]